jgi:hypothetical protein
MKMNRKADQNGTRWEGMDITGAADYQLCLEVDRLFRENATPRGCQAVNPVTDGHYISGLDPTAPQKRAAYCALRARYWFASNGPVDAPRLPLSYGEREDLKVGGLPHIVAWYARSLEGLDYDIKRHPSFERYAKGVMASPHTPTFITENEELRRRFAPLPLEGLDHGGYYWDPPESAPQWRAL